MNTPAVNQDISVASAETVSILCDILEDSSDKDKSPIFIVDNKFINDIVESFQEDFINNLKRSHNIRMDKKSFRIGAAGVEFDVHSGRNKRHVYIGRQYTHPSYGRIASFQ